MENKARATQSTSDDADAQVEKNDGVSEGSGGDGQSAHESPSNDHRAAAKAVHQHAANGPCNSGGREKEKQSSDKTVGTVASLRLASPAPLLTPRAPGEAAPPPPPLACVGCTSDSLRSRRDNVKHGARRSINN